MPTVYVAVGHGRRPDGRHDPGAVAHPYVEYDLARRAAARYSAAMRRAGLGVYCESDAGPGHDPNWPGSARAANDMGAATADELHFNAGGGSGVEIVVHPGTSARNREALRFAASLIAERLGLPLRRGDGLWERSDLGFLRRTRMPASIVEICFVDHPTDRSVLAGDGWAGYVGEALAEARCHMLAVDYIPPDQEVPAMRSIPAVYARRGSIDAQIAQAIHGAQPAGVVTVDLAMAEHLVNEGARVIAVGGPSCRDVHDIDDDLEPGVHRPTPEKVLVLGGTALHTAQLLTELAKAGWE